jgi:hypothetical protein
MKKLMWLILLLSIQGMTFGLSRAWAQKRNHSAKWETGDLCLR